MSGPRVPRCIALLAVFALHACGAPQAPSAPDSPALMRLAVLGNSDSHAYHDSVSFPPGSPERGGAQRAATFQWTELLAQWRADTIDQGAWGRRGGSPRRTRIAALIGIKMRTPLKQDFAYNFSWSGARCRDLPGPRGQLAQLLRTMRESPDAWKGGVVLFRIGINDLGRREVLEAVARDHYAGSQHDLVRSCTDTIIAAVRAVRAVQPAVRIALVGILDNTNWPPNFDLRLDSAGLASVRRMLDDYDEALRSFAAATPGVGFIDDRAWYAAQWGTRTSTGEPAFRTVERAGLQVTLTQGDGLSHAFVADGHAGTVFNALWVQRLVVEMNARLGTAIPPITDAEIEAFLRPLIAR